MCGIAVSPFEHEIDQSHLHERRLLLLQRVQDSVLHLGLPAVAAESIERRQAHVDTRVVAQGVKKSRKYLWIELLFAGAPSDPSSRALADCCCSIESTTNCFMLVSSICMAAKSGERGLGAAKRSPAKTPMVSSATPHAIAPTGERSQWNTFQFQAEAGFL